MNSIENMNQETSIKIKAFSVVTEKPDEFIEELEILCKKFCPDGRYLFKYSFEG